MKRLRTLFGANTPRNDENPLEGTVYAIGDIHGHAKKLKGLLKAILAHSKSQNGPFTLIGLGDYINRGPESAEVIATLRLGLPEGWKSQFLRGNHEQALVDFLNNPEANVSWLGWGGTETCQSYGIKPYGSSGLREAGALAAELKLALEETGDLAWLKKTKLTHTAGPYAFVHAGVRPGVALESQMPEDLLYIREDWINRPHKLPFTIVFGHTIFPAPLLGEDRIGLDTGAYTGGPLTAVALSATQAPEFVQYT